MPGNFIAAAAAAAAAAPFLWEQLRDYQRQRLLTFLHPEQDPLGYGYHILQSKIALGSGGVFGRGYLGGTQARLDFLPEKHTDFIFTLIGEEFGLMGGLLLIALHLALFLSLLVMAWRCRSLFPRLLIAGSRSISPSTPTSISPWSRASCRWSACPCRSSPTAGRWP